MGIGVGAAFGEQLHGGAHLGQAGRDAELGTEFVQLNQVVAQGHLALPLQGMAHGGGAHIGVAVAVAANPVAHAQEGGQVLPGQGLLKVLVKLGNLAQEGGRVVGEGVLDLIGYGELAVAQHARLPKLGDAGAKRVFIALQVPGQAQQVPVGNQVGDGPFGVQDALALHFGRVRGQHGRDMGALQQSAHIGRAHTGFVHLLQAVGQRASLHVAFALVVLAPAHVVAVLGQVGQVAEVAEGANHHHGLVGREALEQLVDLLACALVLRTPPRHAELANAFHELVGLTTFLVANHFTQKAAEQPNVVAQRLVFGRRVLGGGRAWHGCPRWHEVMLKCN